MHITTRRGHPSREVLSGHASSWSVWKFNWRRAPGYRKIVQIWIRGAPLEVLEQDLWHARVTLDKLDKMPFIVTDVNLPFLSRPRARGFGYNNSNTERAQLDQLKWWDSRWWFQRRISHSRRRADYRFRYSTLKWRKRSLQLYVWHRSKSQVVPCWNYPQSWD